MGTITVYVSKEIERKIAEEVADRKGEIINGKAVGDSHIIQEALKDRYEKKDKEAKKVGP